MDDEDEHVDQGHYVEKGKIDDDFKIEFLDGKAVIEPNKFFKVEDLGVKEIKVRRAPFSLKRIGHGHQAGHIIISIIPLPFLLPLGIFTSNHMPTKHFMNKVSYRIAITKPNGKKYYGKMAFFKVSHKCSTGVGSYYNISIPNEKFQKLDNGSSSIFSQFEYCDKRYMISWVIWDVKKEIN